MAGDPAIGHLEADELARDSLLLLPLEGLAAEELPLLHLHDPAEVRFPGSDRVVDVVAVEGHLRLQAQRVARAEAARNDPLGPARFEQAAEDLLGRLRREVQLETIFPGVAGAGDERGLAEHLRRPEGVVRKILRVARGDPGDDGRCPRPLYLEQRVVVAPVLDTDVALRAR